MQFGKKRTIDKSSLYQGLGLESSLVVEIRKIEIFTYQLK